MIQRIESYDVWIAGTVPFCVKETRSLDELARIRGIRSPGIGSPKSPLVDPVTQVVHEWVHPSIRDIGIGGKVPSSVEIGTWRSSLDPAMRKIMIQRIESYHVWIADTVPVRVEKARSLDNAAITCVTNLGHQCSLQCYSVKFAPVSPRSLRF
jgi:hypothetical protein